MGVCFKRGRTRDNFDAARQPLRCGAPFRRPGKRFRGELRRHFLGRSLAYNGAELVGAARRRAGAAREGGGRSGGWFAVGVTSQQVSPFPVIGVLKAKQRLGKYRIERKLGVGGFSVVYQAMDTIEGVRVALKIPHQHLVTPEVLEEFRQEARMMARLEHPNILPLKNAEFIDDKFVIVYPLGEKTLTERLQSRISLSTALDYAEQMLSAVAYAHEHRIIHCDVKPDNVILFSGGRLRLADFGIAKVANRTIRASGSGTVGYVAPEQAMGRPSFRSDVFSLGLILYRMLTGRLPEWPYDWPPPGIERLRRRHGDLVALVRKAIEVNPRRRYRDAGSMLEALRRIKPRVMRHAERQSARARTTKKANRRTRKGPRR